MNDEITIWISGYWPESLNRTRGQHWSKGKQQKQLAKDLLYIACIQRHGVVPIFVGKVQVDLVRLYQGNRKALDRDNLIGSTKVLIDAMRRPKAMKNQRGLCSQGGIGIIEDDSPDHLDDDTRQARVKFLTEGDVAAFITVRGDRRI